MSRFTGGVEGRGRMMTRTGTESSGMRTFAHADTGRIEVELHRGPGHDWANISIHGDRGRHHLPGFDLDLVAKALDSGDPKVQRIWDRIRNDIQRLHDDAPKALKRANTARLEEERQARFAHARALEARREFAGTITDAEAEHFIALTGMTNDESDREAFLHRAKFAAASSEIMEPRRYKGHLIVAVTLSDESLWGNTLKFFNLTDGIEVELEAVPVV